jgi:hypothetical protein
VYSDAQQKAELHSIPFGKLKMPFKPNRKFKKKYNWIFKKDPLAANTFLLLAELADDEGRIVTNEREIIELMAIRFENPRSYAL